MGLDTVELVLAIEQEFAIDIPNDVAETLLSVRHVRDFILVEYARLGRPTPDPDELFTRLHGLVAEQAGVKPEAVHLDTEFAGDLRMD